MRGPEHDRQPVGAPDAGPPAQPAEPPVNASSPLRPSGPWTADRDRRAMDLRAAGKTYSAILADLNRMPGAPIPNTKAVENRCYRLRHALPSTRDGAPSLALRQVADDAAREAATLISFDDALDWGRHNGLKELAGERLEQTFARINTLRKSHALPPFTLVTPRGPHVSLPHPHYGGDEARA